MENGREIPENANDHCPGPESDSAGKSDACEGRPNQQICAIAPKRPDPERGGYGGERYEQLGFQSKVLQQYRRMRDHSWKVNLP